MALKDILAELSGPAPKTPLKDILAELSGPAAGSAETVPSRPPSYSLDQTATGRAARAAGAPAPADVARQQIRRQKVEQGREMVKSDMPPKPYGGAGPLAPILDPISSAAVKFGHWYDKQPGRVVEGIDDIREGNVSRGIYTAATGALGIAAPFVPPLITSALIAAPATVAAGFVGGEIANQAITHLGPKLGMTEDQARLAGLGADMAVGGGGVLKGIRGAARAGMPDIRSVVPKIALATPPVSPALPRQLPEAPFGMATGTAAPTIASKVVPLSQARMPQRYIGPERQIEAGPSAIPVGPAATGRTPPSTFEPATGTIPPYARKYGSLDEMAARVEELKGASDMVEVAEAEKLKSYLSQRGETMPMPMAETGGQQGTFWQRGPIYEPRPTRALKPLGGDVADPAARDAALADQKIVQQAETLKGEEAAKTAPTPTRPPYSRYEATRIRAESMGHSVTTEVVPPTAGIMQTQPMDPASIASYPAMKKVAAKILKARATEEKSLTQLDSLRRVPPTEGTAKRIAAAETKMSKARDTGMTRTDEDQLLSQVARIEQSVPKASLAGARGGPRGEAPRFGEPPPAPETPSAPKPPMEPIHRRGPFYRRMSTPGENIRGIAGKEGEELVEDISRGSKEARAESGRLRHNLAEAGIEKLEPGGAEDMNIMAVLEGRAEPISEAAARLATLGRNIYDTIRSAARFDSEEGFPLAVRNEDGSFSLFHGLDAGYAPHIMHPPNILGDVNNPIRKRVIDGMVERRNAENVNDAAELLDGYVAMVEGRMEAPPKLVQYVAKQRNISDQAAEKLLKRYKLPSPGKMGSLDFSRTLDLPFYDPSFSAGILNYVDKAPMRLELLKATTQKDASGKYMLFDKQGKPVPTRIKVLLDRMRDRPLEGPQEDKSMLIQTVSDDLDKILGSGDKAAQDRAWDEVMTTLRLAGTTMIGFAASGLNNLQASLWGLTETNFPTVAAAWREHVGAVFTKSGRKERRRITSIIGGKKAGMKEALLQANVPESTAGLPPARKLLRRTNKLLSKYVDFYLTMIRFSAGETRQRVLGFRMGRKWGREMAERLSKNPEDQWARNELTNLTLDPDDIVRRVQAGEELISMKEADRIGLALSDRINFSHRPEDLPSFVGNDSSMRTLMQLRTYMYGATKLTHKALIREYKSGNKGRAWRNLALMGTVFAFSGEMGNALRDLTGGNRERMKKRHKLYGDFLTDPEEHAFEVIRAYLGNVAEVGVFAGYWNIIESGEYGAIVEQAAPAALGKLALPIERGVLPMAKDIAEGNWEAATLHGLKAFLEFEPTMKAAILPFYKETLQEDIKAAQRGSAKVPLRR